ncbi:uncharacterized protein MELLADRAFT_49440 [Melampsora larici-populina 98AG31]|uniref:UDP-glucose 4-epimerase n=1 Tax=Melampsora larici-populina (strain 98AG31 / pathotype 3-4-7) TaxID=747676 RepID=F4RV96_MELLP|nr:uncharacterized protein MELLADRAFT_49440 [Melampsora larici-populina 98AG31]EGG03706.1 hypothetical protein MELLADRAFT_49440 [Melampsora larici-populina 98AG31]
MPEKKTILGTGGAGYIGSHVVLCCLLTRKYKVVTIDNFHNSFPEAIKRVSKIALNELPTNSSDQDKLDTNVKVYKGDITNKSDIENIFKSEEIWGVIHIAAHKAVGESGEKPIQYYENNITATINLLDVMNRNGCYNLVYSSSATVYGAPTEIPIPESSPLTPESVYGRTKMMSELIIKDLCDSQPTKWKSISLRYFNPAGAHPSGMIGEDPVGKPGNLLPLLAQMAVGKIPHDLKINGNDYPTRDGACIRDYIHVMDLAGGHINALDGLSKETTWETPCPGFKSGFGTSGGKYKAYNLGKGRGQSVFEMIEAMRKATGFDYKYEIIGRRLGDVPDLTADPSLAKKELGFDASRDLDTMCRDLWNWQSQNPKGILSLISLNWVVNGPLIPLFLNYF